VNVQIPSIEGVGGKPKIPKHLEDEFAELLTGKYGRFIIQPYWAHTWPNLNNGIDFKKISFHKPVECFFPFSEISIRVDGRYGVCCYDLGAELTYGNIFENGLEEIFGSAYYIGLRKRIVNVGHPDYPVCKTCYYKTGELLVKKYITTRNLI
jgi:hypothetical protein